MAMLSASNAESLLDYTFGALEELRGNDQRAGEHYERAYSSDPTAMPLVRKIAEKRLAENERAAAVQIYQDVLIARPGEPMLFMEFGDFLGHIGNGDSIALRLQEKSYLEMLKQMPGRFLPIERLIRLARENGNDNRARELLEQLDPTTTEAAKYYVATTKSLYDSRDMDARNRINECFAEALNRNPQCAVIARAASDHFREIGDMAMAISVLRKHVEADPSSIDHTIRLGILMISENFEREGEAILKRVTTLHPGKAIAHESLAKLYRRNGDKSGAGRHAAELLKIRGGTPDEFSILADELLGDEEFRAARLLLEKAVFDHEDDAGLRMKLALATSRDPEYKDNAPRLFREAEALLANPSEMDPAFLLASARELELQGKSKAAEQRLRTAIRSFPKNAKKESAAAMRALAAIWKRENRNIDAANALILRADALEK